MFTFLFWRAAIERAGKTACQAGLLVIGADRFNVLDMDWANLGGFMAGGAVLSILTSVASSKIGDAGPSVAGETLTGNVAAEADPASPTGAVAGPAADIPEGQPVQVTDAAIGDGLGAGVQSVADGVYASDPKTDAAGRQD